MNKLEKKLVASDVEILKAGRHGSRSSSSGEFLNRLRSKICIISVGRQNTYGHPTIETLRRMVENHCTILRTDTLGDINVEI